MRLPVALSLLSVAAALLTACSRDPILTDSDGQSYRVKQLAKQDIRYRKLADGWVRVAPYFQYRLEREDDEYLYVREYVTPADRGGATAQSATAARDPAPTAGEPPALPGGDRIVLAPFGDGLPGAGQWRNAFALADLNGDTHLDLVHGPPARGGGPRVFLGDGAGRWKPWADATYPPGPYDYGAIAVADFNGDAQLDIALAAHLQGITVLLGDGQGRFRSGATPADLEPDPTTRFTTRALLARDWNRDGRADLVAVGEGPSRAGGGSFGWVVYLNQDGGGWRKHAQPAGAAGTFGDALAVGDFDADGRADLVTASLALGHRDIVHYGGTPERTVTVDAIRPQTLVSPSPARTSTPTAGMTSRSAPSASRTAAGARRSTSCSRGPTGPGGAPCCTTSRSAIRRIRWRPATSTATVTRTSPRWMTALRCASSSATAPATSRSNSLPRCHRSGPAAAVTRCSSPT
jgi:hypothetical protein